MFVLLNTVHFGSGVYDTDYFSAGNFASIFFSAVFSTSLFFGVGLSATHLCEACVCFCKPAFSALIS